MSSDALLVIQCIFQTIWSLFTSFQIPGTQTTPLEWAIFCLVVVFVIRFVKRFISQEDK